MYTNDPTSLFPCLTPLLSLFIASSYREKDECDKLVIYSRLFRSRPSSKKASREKEPTRLHLHHPPQHHYFISLCILSVREVFAGIRGLWIQRLWKPELLWGCYCSASRPHSSSIKHYQKTIETCIWSSDSWIRISRKDNVIVKFSITVQLSCFACWIHRIQHVHTDGSWPQYV